MYGLETTHIIQALQKLLFKKDEDNVKKLNF